MVDSNFAHNFFKPGAYLGQSYTLFAVSAAVYAAGRIKHEPKVSHMGMDLLQAVAVSEGIAQVLKYATRRERPDGSGKTSFPSGHAADTFAFATALERHFGWKGAVPAYIFASYVAISRLPANRHWLSDAVFGSSVGIIAGRTVSGFASRPLARPRRIAFHCRSPRRPRLTSWRYCSKPGNLIDDRVRRCIRPAPRDIAAGGRAVGMASDRARNRERVDLDREPAYARSAAVTRESVR
jgi:PAP2 superfamily